MSRRTGNKEGGGEGEKSKETREFTLIHSLFAEPAYCSLTPEFSFSSRNLSLGLPLPGPYAPRDLLASGM